MKTSSMLLVTLLCTGLISACKVESKKVNISPDPVETVSGWDEFSKKIKRDEDRKTTESTKKNELLKYYMSAPIPEEVVHKGFIIENKLSPDLVGSEKFNHVQNPVIEVYFFRYYRDQVNLEIVTETKPRLVIPVEVVYGDQIGKDELIVFFKDYVHDTSWQTQKIKKSDLEKVKVK
jgi:hypothetical protein